MDPVAPRALAIMALGLLTALHLVAAEAPRSAPTRPGAASSAPAQKPVATAPANRAPAKTNSAPRPAPRAPKREDIALDEVAKKLGLKFTAAADGKRVVLADAHRRVELDVDSRETRMNGLRVFLGDAVRARGGRFYVDRIDYQTCLVPMLRPAAISPRPPRPRIVAIDAGHGGVDNGMENAALGLKEKELTLDVARRLQRLLEQEGLRVVLTRKDDRALHPEKIKDFAMRAEVANSAGADLLVSIHFNSLFPDTRTGGTEVYTFTRANQRSDRSWGFGQDDDTETSDSPVNRHDAASGLLAHQIHRELIAELKTADRGLKTMHSAMLRRLTCPAVLVESAFLSNAAEARLVATPEYRQRIAQAIADGIFAYGSTLKALGAN